MVELHNALQQMPNKKAPGPDGFPAEFYKTFCPILETLFYRMVNEIKET